MDGLEFAKGISDIILTKKGYDIKILDLKNISSVADYFLICSAGSDIQVKAIADEVDKVLRKNGIKCMMKEGYDSLNWVLMDYFDVVVHIFKEDARSFYNLEKLWADAPSITIEDPDNIPAE